MRSNVKKMIAAVMASKADHRITNGILLLRSLTTNRAEDECLLLPPELLLLTFAVPVCSRGKKVITIAVKPKTR